MKGLLDGIRVVELTSWIFGPLAGMMLADLGADVIKIEAPDGGDPARGVRWMMGSVDCAMPGDRNALVECCNRNKRSVSLNLKHERGRAAMFRLLENADVFLHNFRAGVPERLGLGYEELSARFPQLIYAAASGYGPEGPEAGRPALDYVGQARSGLMWGPGHPGDPPYYNTGGTADTVGAIMLAFGVVAAIAGRNELGHGQKVDVSHLGAAMWLQNWSIGVSQLMHLPEWPRFDRGNAGNPLWNHYQCGDGGWIALALIQADRYWVDFVEAMGLPELLADERFHDLDSRREHNKALIAILDARFRAEPRSYWEARFRRYPDFMWERIQKVTDLPGDPQALANNYLVPYDYPGAGEVYLLNFPVTFSETPSQIRKVAPLAGEDTFDVLLAAGFGEEEIADMAVKGVI